MRVRAVLEHDQFRVLDGRGQRAGEPGGGSSVVPPEGDLNWGLDQLEHRGRVVGQHRAGGPDAQASRENAITTVYCTPP